MSGSVLDWFLNSLTPTPNETHVPSTAEIIQKCLAVNPFELKFREANRRLSQSHDGLDQNGLVTNTLLPTSAGLSMLKLSSSLNQSPTIFSNISLLSADLDFTRKLRESGLMNAGKAEGNRTPCTADVLNAVLDMNMNNQQMAAAVAAVNHQQQQSSNSLSQPTHNLNNIAATVAINGITNADALNFGFSSPSKLNTPSTMAMSVPASTTVDMITPSSSLTTLQPSALNATNLNHLNDAEKPNTSVLNIETNWESDVKPDISGAPPLKRMATEQNINSQSSTFYHSDDSPFSNSSSVSNSRRSEEPVKTTRKYHSRCTDGTSTQKGGRGRRSITSDMPPDERRQTILERNKAAAVRYRKRKKEEHDEMIGRVNILEQEKNALSTQNSVLRRENERLTELLKLRESRCVCHAAQLGGNSQSILPSLPPELLGDHNFGLHRQRNN
uniref:BZIP domain-containing protein n=1 Tax=Panagrolaimus sp. JU765 TaxID=591449 RepID=A0AC34Q8N8_9BILA